MSRPEPPPKGVILGCAGLALLDAERRLFRDANPLGFILFERNCRDPEQVRDLVTALRQAVGRADAPVLIDQEGGRVARLGPPHWRLPPPSACFGELAARDPAAAAEAACLNARLIADDLYALGITVDCAPLADVLDASGHGVIGDRAFSARPDEVAALARAFCQGLLEGGVLPVIKHVPGHGRAGVDSHRRRPVVETSCQELRRRDFAPFKALNDMPWAMTAHVVYSTLDPDSPATVSTLVIAGVIRGEIGFDGLLLSDDVSMAALSGSLAARTRAALAAGCDVVLHCSGELSEMAEVAEAAGPLSAAAQRRSRSAAAMIGRPRAVDSEALFERLQRLLSTPAEARP